MCGIFAAISLGEPFSQSDYYKFVQLTDLVSYRGPDSGDYKTFSLISAPDKNSKFNIFLGHRRLSIIDLSTDGVQPMSHNGIHIIFNGEIFNYIELRNELKSLNVSFKTNTDTEVLLRLYEKFGSLAFDKLNGMWAFVIFDSNKKIILASRDRFSIKPLYLLRVDENYYFASEIKQLLQLIPSHKINLRIMGKFLHQGILDVDSDTFFQGIQSVEAKHNYLIDLNNKKMRKEKYWDYRFFNVRDNEIVETFRDLFFDSIKIRLRSDVELGLLLSGGLDSSAISVVGKVINDDKFKTYSIISETKKYSEERFIDILTSKNKLSNEKLIIKANDIIKNFENVIKQQDEPFLNFIVVAHYTILKKIKTDTNITVVLNGQGGDESLAGYLRFFFFNLKYLIDSGKYFKAVKEIIGSLLYRTVLMQWQFAAAKRYLPKLRDDGKIILLETEPENTWSFKNMAEAQIANIDRFSVPPITKYEDRNSMAHSLEIRLPFLDHRLVEFLINIDSSYKIKNGWSKYVLRKSMHELPDEIRWRKDKKGFILPEEIWLKNDFRQDIIKCFNKSKLDEYGIIDSKKFLKKYHSYLKGNRTVHSLEISRIYIAEKWMQEFFGE